MFYLNNKWMWTTLNSDPLTRYLIFLMENQPPKKCLNPKRRKQNLPFSTFSPGLPGANLGTSRGHLDATGQDKHLMIPSLTSNPLSPDMAHTENQRFFLAKKEIPEQNPYVQLLCQFSGQVSVIVVSAEKNPAACAAQGAETANSSRASWLCAASFTTGLSVDMSSWKPLPLEMRALTEVDRSRLIQTMWFWILAGIIV